MFIKILDNEDKAQSLQWPSISKQKHLLLLSYSLISPGVAFRKSSWKFLEGIILFPFAGHPLSSTNPSVLCCCFQTWL